MTEQGRARLSGIQRASSVTLDPHKSLFLPYGTGCLLVRESQSLLDSFQSSAPYLESNDDDEQIGAAPNACDLSPELSRECRGLRVWLPLMACGSRRFAQTLEDKLELTKQLVEHLKNWNDQIQFADWPQLTTVAFRFLNPAESEPSIDKLNREIVATVNARGRCFIKTTQLRGHIYIRVCVLSLRSSQQNISDLIEDLRVAFREKCECVMGSQRT